MSASTQASLTRMFAKPLVNGAVSAAAMGYLFGTDKGFYVGQTRIPILAFGGLLGAVGSFATETVTQWVLPYTIGKDPKILKLESMVISVGASAGLFAVLPKVVNSDVDSADMGKLAMAGAVTELASSYLYGGVVAGKGSILGGAY